jgi:hypothetical protein
MTNAAPKPNASSPRANTRAEARSNAATAATAPNTGRVLVRSTPAGATVFIDGRQSGRTPIAVRDLSHGTHRVRIVREGYAPVDRRIVITGSRPSQSLIVPLEAERSAARNARTRAEAAAGGIAAIERYTGTVEIDSRPTGAKVYLDNRLVGSTPMAIPDVRAGEHVVRLEHDGYRRWTSMVRVVAAERNRVTASLEK